MCQDTSQLRRMQERLQGLYLVSTPIGNLNDFSKRGIYVLQNSDLIACEDTRITKRLLSRYQIKTPLTSYHKFSTRKKQNFILEKAREGILSIVSDAGTPIIADPGADMVIRARIEGIPVTAIPGACSVINAIVLSGADVTSFFYGGWNLSFSSSTAVFLIAPHKLIKSIESLVEIFGGKRKCSLVREMTKIHEEVITNTLDHLLSYYKANKVKGEITAVVHAAKEEPKKSEVWQQWIDEAVKYLPPSRAAQLISKIAAVQKQEVYKYAISKNEKR